MADIRVAAERSSTLPRWRSALGALTAVLPGWALALVLSAVIVAAGRLWPDPLQPRAGLALALVLLPPLLLAGVLLRGGAGSARGGESGD